MVLALSKRFGGLSMAATNSESNAFPEKGLLLVGMGMGSLNGMTVEAQTAAKEHVSLNTEFELDF